MGSGDSKLHFRKAVIQLTTKTQPVEASDDAFWDQFWSDASTTVQDIFALVPAAEIRAVREESPSNLATLCYKAVEKLVQGADSGCSSEKQRQTVLNCTRLLTRILPYIFEDADWRGFFWSTVPGAGRAGNLEEDDGEDEARPLAELLLLAIADLLFCPDFTVQSCKRNSPDTALDTQAIDSCEYIWEAGVGFAHSPPYNHVHDTNRTELLKLLLTCFSEAMYLPPSADRKSVNPWVSFFCSSENRHALPLFTSLLNVVCAYDPVGYGIPYNYLLSSDQREQLVVHVIQVLIIALEHEGVARASLQVLGGISPSAAVGQQEPAEAENLFVNYLSRIHRDEDLSFMLKGLTQLLNNPLVQTYLPHSAKKIQFHQELLLLFWKLCDINKKFLFFVLKSSDVLDVLVPILFYLNDARADQSRVGLVHIGVFILLLLSGERNFGVRLNKPYVLRVPMDIPVFTGTHADLLIVIFHKIVSSGHHRLQPLFDCLLTVIVNISPYLKSLSMVAANKLLHLLEAFSTPWFLFSSPQNHYLVFFLLEVFNNVIQYQFDGNSNLVYAIIRKRSIFHQLANLPSDMASIQKALQQKKRKSGLSRSGSVTSEAADNSRVPVAAEPRMFNASLEATPGIDKITEKAQVSEEGTMVSVSDVPPSVGTSDTESNLDRDHEISHAQSETTSGQPSAISASAPWSANPDWVTSWKVKLPLQTIMRLLQVLVPQVEKICIDKGLTDESEILNFLQHGTLVGLLPVPHPILIRKYQANAGTAAWFRTYMWGVIYLRNVDPPVWYDTDIRLFEIQRI
ncbi:protein HID1b isoform X2 [Takifugu rubripes]|uniref:HID1 domain containing n=1 Tax=Takifugu rubripes TaxID=31033 RepID=H2SJN1_TAKRU|nr:protein HID1-like isoform X2 [Takifugu rubripes]|eukprot:XP_003961150.1 PREDICTED: protein HID1-like [Takifugu rubripes]